MLLTKPSNAPLIIIKIYISFITNYDSENKQFAAKESIIIAKIFVDEFEKFENEFLKENYNNKEEK